MTLEKKLTAQIRKEFISNFLGQNLSIKNKLIPPLNSEVIPFQFVLKEGAGFSILPPEFWWTGFLQSCEALSPAPSLEAWRWEMWGRSIGEVSELWRPVRNSWVTEWMNILMKIHHILLPFFGDWIRLSDLFSTYAWKIHERSQTQHDKIWQGYSPFPPLRVPFPGYRGRHSRTTWATRCGTCGSCAGAGVDGEMAGGWWVLLGLCKKKQDITGEWFKKGKL